MKHLALESDKKSYNKQQLTNEQNDTYIAMIVQSTPLLLYDHHPWHFLDIDVYQPIDSLILLYIQDLQ